MAELIASEQMQDYFNGLESRLKLELEIANTARSLGKDPKPYVEIPIAKDLADRVENLIGVKGVAECIRRLEETMSREEAALAIGKEVAEGTVGSFASKVEAVEAAIRVSVAMLTEGVVAAPIEGIDGVTIQKNDDGNLGSDLRCKSEFRNKRRKKNFGGNTRYTGQPGNGHQRSHRRGSYGPIRQNPLLPRQRVKPCFAAPDNNRSRS